MLAINIIIILQSIHVLQSTIHILINYQILCGTKVGSII